MRAGALILSQRLSGTSPLAANAWTHLAVTLSGTTGTLYVDGVAVATNTNMTLSPSSLGATTNNWIGNLSTTPTRC
jgi:hypothetical protein